ncbi:N-terminal methionine N(alpha)-acetyltransferase NatB [Malassezia cuniculi]|uniref:N-terminal methionine N(Alpha)-acetyltransferase NatB n=1 Tax=Malassezia cuniculi TaxID=948313 RepID=A0AAF0EQS3_9BASI|nr:N-terminal methionine N(alpha)-acetyltransferase NatB [Malassezia cuniculi]
MTTVRPFSVSDLFHFNNVNMDSWTETYSCAFYTNYSAQWPDLLFTASAANSDRVMGYIIGKAEGSEPTRSKKTPTLHGHVTAVTVAPEYRRLGVAGMLMDMLEHASDAIYHGYFVDLFVRPSNVTAINMYKNLGYSVYRRVDKYYHGDGRQPTEDGYDMRKALPRDTKKQTVRENGVNMVVQPYDTLFEPCVHKSV